MLKVKYSVKAFFEAVNKNPELKTEFKKLRIKYRKLQLSERESLDFLLKDLIPFARKLGFLFDVKDYLAYQKEEETKELTEEELDQVSGGAGGGFISPKLLGICGTLAMLAGATFVVPSSSSLNPEMATHQTSAAFGSKKSAILKNGTEVQNAERQLGLVFELHDQANNEPGTATIRGISRHATQQMSEYIIIPEEIESDGKIYRVTEIAEGAFANEGNIREVIIPESIVHVRRNAFKGCVNLEKLTILNSRNNPSINLWDGAFLDTNLTGRIITERPISTPGGYYEEVFPESVSVFSGESTTMLPCTFIGDGGAGKTSLMCILSGQYDQIAEDHISTIGMDWLVKTVPIEQGSCRLILYDTGGQDRYDSIVNSHFTSGDFGGGVGLITCDINSFKEDGDPSLARTIERYQYLKEYFRRPALVCTKMDTIEDEQEREILKERAAQFAENLGIRDKIFVSSLTGEGIGEINQLISSLATQVIDETNDLLPFPLFDHKAPPHEEIPSLFSRLFKR